MELSFFETVNRRTMDDESSSSPPPKMAPSLKATPEGLRVSGTQCLAVRSETALPRKRRVSHFSDTLVLQPIDR